MNLFAKTSQFLLHKSIKEKSTNASGTRQQDIADEFNAELDEIYNHTKKIIVDENNTQSEIENVDLPSIFQNTENETTIFQTQQTEQTNRGSETNKDQIVTRSKSSKSDVVPETVNSSEELHNP